MATKKAAPAKPMTKTEILTSLAEGTGLSKKDVGSVLDDLGTLIGKNLGKRGRRFGLRARNGARHAARDALGDNVTTNREICDGGAGRHC